MTPTNDFATPKPPPSGDILTEDQANAATQHGSVLGVSLASDRRALDNHMTHVGGDLLDQGHKRGDPQEPPALVDTSAGGRRTVDTHTPSAPGVPVPPDPAIVEATPGNGSPGGWDALRLFAEMYEDAQKARIGCENRVRSATVDEDLTAALLAALGNAENELKKALAKQYKRTVPAPIQEWAKQTKGIGKTSPHLLARLLGVIGHPVLATPHHWEGEGTDRVLVADPPFLRNVAKLWAYCGHGDPSRKRAKGMSAAQAASLGNPRAKMIVHLLAESVVKQKNEDYRLVYDTRREATAVTHPDWSKGHSHNDALHIVAKEILRDLWRAGSVDL